MPSRTLLAFALATVIAAPAWAAQDTHPDLSIYRSDSSSLFNAGTDGAVNAGYAVVHEQRTVHLDSGTHDIALSDLPDYLDPEAVTLGFDSDKVQVLSQRLLLPRGQNGSLSGHIGKSVTVLGSTGKQLAEGLLVRVNHDGSLVLGGDVFGPTVIRNYAAVRLTGGQVGGGARLQLRVTAASSGNQDATLTYPTSGLGWRAAYTAIMQPKHGCHMQLKAQASIANRSGRDWKDANVKLVAGSPNMGKPKARQSMMSANAVRAESAPMPKQRTLGNYRTYTLAGAVTLPASSVTLTPLYKSRTISCQRTLLFEHGNTYRPSKPALTSNNGGAQHGPVNDILRFTAFDSFPAGYLRVLTTDNDGIMQFLGEGRVNDTPKGQTVKLAVGAAFDLTGTRERSSFKINKSERTMDVGYHIALNNADKNAHTVTVREHPWRWRNWTLTSSSISPARQTTDTLEFSVKVPAQGSATLDYSVQYSWTAADE